MKVKWLSEARSEYRDLLLYIRTSYGLPAAKKFATMMLDGIYQLERFPEIGVKKDWTLMGEYGFRALFIDKYACVYRFDEDTIWIYHLADARMNYIYNIFGIEYF